MKKDKTEDKTLMEGLIDEMNRVRELIIEYKGLPNGVGLTGASLMQLDIGYAERAIVQDNVIDMLKAYEKLKSCQ